jgi:hypothetical protein
MLIDQEFAGLDSHALGSTLASSVVVGALADHILAPHGGQSARVPTATGEAPVLPGINLRCGRFLYCSFSRVLVGKGRRI